MDEGEERNGKGKKREDGLRELADLSQREAAKLSARRWPRRLLGSQI